MFFVIGFLKKDFEEKREEKLLNGKTKTIKVVINNAGMALYGYSIGFKFKVSNVLKEISISGTRHNFLEVGDTILIKYSVEDPTVVEVVDPCYMQKHKVKPCCK